MTTLISNLSSIWEHSIFKILFLVLCAQLSYGQIAVEIKEDTTNYKPHKFRLGLTPSAILWRYPFIQANYAFDFNENLVYAGEFGVAIDNQTGLKLRNSFLIKFAEVRNSRTFYIGLGHQYRELNKEGFLTYSIEEGFTRYFQSANTKQKFTQSLFYLAGLMRVEFKDRIDVVLTLGAGSADFNIESTAIGSFLPPNANIETNHYRFIEDEDLGISGFVDFQIQYKF